MGYCPWGHKDTLSNRVQEQSLSMRACPQTAVLALPLHPYREAGGRAPGRQLAGEGAPCCGHGTAGTKLQREGHLIRLSLLLFTRS